MIIIQDKSKSQVNDDRRFFMKKTILFLIVAALLPFSALFGACSGGGTFTARNYDSGDAEITALCVDAEDRTVEVGISDDGRIHIDCAESEKEFYDIEFECGDIRPAARVLVITDRTGLLEKKDYKIVSSQLIAADHAAIILNGYDYVSEHIH